MPPQGKGRIPPQNGGDERDPRPRRPTGVQELDRDLIELGRGRPYVMPMLFERQCHYVQAAGHPVQLDNALIWSPLETRVDAVRRWMRRKHSTGSAAQMQHFRCRLSGCARVPFSAAASRNLTRAVYGFSTGSRTAFPHSVHDPS
jgi:hypothetical protein